jgi:hypothetical protein
MVPRTGLDFAERRKVFAFVRNLMLWATNL